MGALASRSRWNHGPLSRGKFAFAGYFLGSTGVALLISYPTNDMLWRSAYKICASNKFCVLRRVKNTGHPYLCSADPNTSDQTVFVSFGDTQVYSSGCEV